MKDIGSGGRELALDDTLVGFRVVSPDGRVGTVDHVNYTGTCLSVQTGRLLRKARHLIPATAVRSIDRDHKSVDVAMTAEEVEGAPAYEEHGIDDATESRAARYYEGLSR